MSQIRHTDDAAYIANEVSSDSAIRFPGAIKLAPLQPGNPRVTVSTIARGGVATPFPYKLHIMLDMMDSEAAKGNIGGKSIVGWQPHGRAFKVHNAKKFVDTIMPHFFNHTKYASFQRQLNVYGFMRLTVGPDKGAVYHPCFVRNEPTLVSGMVRKRVKGTKIRKVVAPECQPNFYADENLRVIAAVDAAFDSAIAVQKDSKTKAPPTEAVRPKKNLCNNPSQGSTTIVATNKSIAFDVTNRNFTIVGTKAAYGIYETDTSAEQRTIFIDACQSLHEYEKS